MHRSNRAQPAKTMPAETVPAETVPVRTVPIRTLPLKTLPAKSPGAVGLILLIAMLMAWPASADWLVTHRGARLETAGSWLIEAGWVVYHDPQGARRAVHESAVDLDASRRLTADPAAEIRTTEPEGEVSDAAEAKETAVVLYATSWCGYCRKTRQLLKEIGADYVEKDIEKSAEARREYSEKTGGRSGVPVLDIGGKIVRGYRPQEIRQRIAELDTESADNH